MNFFRDIEKPALRATNQVEYARNLLETQGEEKSQEYFNKLTVEEKHNFVIIATCMLTKGVDFVKREVIRANNK